MRTVNENEDIEVEGRISREERKPKRKPEADPSNSGKAMNRQRKKKD